MIPEENEDTVSCFLENHYIPNHIKTSIILHSKSTSTLVSIKCKQNNSTDNGLVLWPKHQYNWIFQEVTKMHMWIFCVYIYIIIPLYQGRCSGFTTIDTIITFDCCMNGLSSHDGLVVYSTIASDYTIIKDVMPGLNNKTETATTISTLMYIITILSHSIYLTLLSLNTSQISLDGCLTELVVQHSHLEVHLICSHFFLPLVLIFY